MSLPLKGLTRFFPLFFLGGGGGGGQGSLWLLRGLAYFCRLLGLCKERKRFTCCFYGMNRLRQVSFVISG